MDEFGLIARHFAPLAAGSQASRQLRDDIALIDLPGSRHLAVTVDTVVEGVHYLAGTTPDLIARKLVRVNFSDLAAKGAAPFAILLAANFPQTTNDAWVAGFASGLKADLEAYGATLIGGDTVSTPGPASFSVTALGWALPGHCPDRSGAKAGDLLWVSGTLGDAALGLQVARGTVPGLDRASHDFLKGRYDLPIPRLELGRRLAPLAHASMDVSDGLFQDIGHLCSSSGLGAHIWSDLIPRSPAFHAAQAIAGGSWLDWVAGGDDYEILIAAPPDATEAIHTHAKASGTTMTMIGRMIAGQGVVVLDRHDAVMPLPRSGWRHFTDESA